MDRVSWALVALAVVCAAMAVRGFFQLSMLENILAIKLGLGFAAIVILLLGSYQRRRDRRS